MSFGRSQRAEFKKYIFNILKRLLGVVEIASRFRSYKLILAKLSNSNWRKSRPV